MVSLSYYSFIVLLYVVGLKDGEHEGQLDCWMTHDERRHVRMSRVSLLDQI
jgi:hypothetical protein